MKKLHFFGLATISALGILGAVAACHGDDTVNTDGTVDAQAPDTSTPPGVDATTTTDGGVTVPPVDAGLKIETYDAVIGDEICNALTKCCFGNANVPQDGGVDGGDAGAGHFDRKACTDIYSRLGFELSNFGIKVTRDKIVVNQEKGALCIDKIRTLACQLDGDSLRTIRGACFDALEGQANENEGCATTLQCARGLWCKSNPDAGASDAGVIGTCVPLRKQGEPCGDVVATTDNASASIDSEIACSWRGGGDTGLACASYDLVTGNYKPNRADWTCQPSVANGAICNNSVSCTNGLCDPGENLDKFKCEPVLTYFTKFSCAADLRP
jgi:hypothetical protein